MPWASKAGHTETVFSCAHRPGDADTMATGSYGSSVKVWHVPTMDLKVKCEKFDWSRRRGRQAKTRWRYSPCLRIL